MASWAETICRVEENLCRKQPDEKLVDMMRLRRSAVLIKCTCHNDTESVQYSFEIYNLIVVKFKEISVEAVKDLLGRKCQDVNLAECDSKCFSINKKYSYNYDHK